MRDDVMTPFRTKQQLIMNVRYVSVRIHTTRLLELPIIITMMHLCILILYSLHLVDGFQNNIVQQPHHSYCRRDNSCGAGSNGLVDFNSDVNLEGVASAEGEIAPHIAIPGGGT